MILAGENSLGTRLIQAGDKSKKRWYVDTHSRRFIEHNRRVWRGYSQSGEAEVLVYFDQLPVNQVRFSYTMNVLAKMHGARIKAFTSTPLGGLRRLDRVYRSFNVGGYVVTRLSATQKVRVEEIFEAKRESLKTKQDVYALRVNGIWVGVDIYDTYLRQTKKPTLAMTDPLLEEVMRRGIGLIIFWQDYLQSHDVKAICISHDNYLGSMDVAKVAHAAEIPVYSPDLSAPMIRGTHNSAYSACVEFPKLFRRLSKAQQEEGIRRARTELDRRLNGGVGVGLPLWQQSAWHKHYSASRVLREGARTKILVCSHEFSDAPHDYGEMLFLDFYEWLVWLGELTHKTDYDWYIKLHPGHWPGSAEVVDELIAKYPRFTLLSSDTSHHQIVEEGIDAVLTCGGTVGHEYPLFGVPVINAGFNKHLAYGFNWHPGSIKEYEELLLNLPELHLPIDTKEIHEFYFMNNFEELSDAVGLDWWNKLNVLTKNEEKNQPIYYSRFLDGLTEAHHEETIVYLERALPKKLRHLAELILP